MGWVVYNTCTGELKRYTQHKSTAEQTVTQHNRDYTFRKLKGERWLNEIDKEWNYCSWTEYETIFVDCNRQTPWKFNLS